MAREALQTGLAGHDADLLETAEEMAWLIR